MKTLYSLIVVLVFIFPVLVNGQQTENHEEFAFETKSGQIIICIDDNVELDDNGFLILGTLKHNQNILNANNDEVPCKAESEVRFDDSGFLQAATLAEPRTYTNSAGEVVEKNEGALIRFDFNGLLGSE